MLNFIAERLKFNRKGFTLVELIISVGTLAIAGTIMIQLFMSAKDMALRSEELDKSVFLANRIVESIKAEKWDSAPLIDMYTQFALRYDNEIEKIGFYDENWVSVQEDSGDKSFEVKLTFKSEDPAEPGKSLYDLNIEVIRLEPYFNGNDEKPVLHSLSTMVYIGTPLEVIEP